MNYTKREVKLKNEVNLFFDKVLEKGKLYIQMYDETFFNFI